MLHSTSVVRCVVMSGSRLLFNNSAWVWERELQRAGLLYSKGVGCCVAMSGAVFNLTTRQGFGRVDFRGQVCRVVRVWVAVL